MRRRLATLLAVLSVGATAPAQPDRSVDTYRDAQDRPASSRAAAFAGAYRAEVQALQRDVDARRSDVAPSGVQRLTGIRERAGQLEEDAARLGAMKRGELRRAQRSLRRELKRLRRELDRTPRAKS